MNELKLNHVYHFASLIESAVYSERNFWHFSEELFIERSLKFSKETLLHLYIETKIYEYYNYEIRKSTDIYAEDVDNFYFFRELFESYQIEINHFDKLFNLEEYIDNIEEEIKNWWKENESQFHTLFNRIADDVFYILFGNRELLLAFNEIVAEQVRDTVYPAEKLTLKEKIKRKNTPQWVKKAVYSRDKGRCTICSKDLTGVISTDQKQHYDHIVPLNLFGANDPTNVQLLCENCNLKKKGSIIETSKKYVKWWI